MSTPNLDSRYSKPADVTAAIAAQAVTDAGQYTQQWKANTTYTTGQVVIAPDGSTVSAVAGFTSGATYSTSNWTVLSPTSTNIAGQYTPQSSIRYLSAKPGHYSVSGGANGTTTSLSGAVWRIPVTLPVSTIRWRINWRNWNHKQNVAVTGVTSPQFRGVYVGTEILDSNGLGTGNFTAAPTLAVASAVLPTDGTTYTSAWVIDSSLQFTACTSLLLSTGLQAGSNGPWAYCRTQQKFTTNSGVASSQTTTFNGTYPLLGEWWIDYEFSGTEPLGLFIGDSLTDGHSPTSKIPQNRNLVNTWAVRERANATSAAVFGIDAQDIASWSSTSHYWTRYGLGNGWVPDFAVVWLGSNDLNDGRTDVQIEADLGTIYNQLYSFGVKRIYGALILPRGLTGTVETYRTSVNSWLMSRPYELRDVFEFDRAVTLSSTATTLDDSRFADSDGVHLLAQGYSKLARTIPHIG